MKVLLLKVKYLDFNTKNIPKGKGRSWLITLDIYLLSNCSPYFLIAFLTFKLLYIQRLTDATTPPFSEAHKT